MKKFYFLAMVLLPAIVFAEEAKSNSITLSVRPSIEFNEPMVIIDYQKLFLENHVGLSAGAGYIEDFQKSAIVPVRLTYIPFNFLIKPDIFAGGVFSYNWRDDKDGDDDSDPVFDKGGDINFECGVGLTVSPVFESVLLGARAHVYTDFEGKALGYITISAGYLF